MPPKHKFTREEILDAAFDLVRQKGWAGLTTRALADQLGSSARPIYSFFKSIKEMEEDIIKRALDLLYETMVMERTGDRWHDHGIGYVMFARQEKHLFRCMNDEDHIIYFKKYGDMIWLTLTDSLDDYQPFNGLNSEQILKIQVTRWLFAHGLAFQVNNPPPDIWNTENIISTIQEGSNAILVGIRSETPKTKQEVDMNDRDPRKMAAQIAGVRAAETHLPEHERVFSDLYAEYFLSDTEREDLTDLERLRAGLAMYDQMMPGVNGAIVARIKFIDECLVECIQNDFRQLVIIGAGYDTRAYRIADVKEHLSVFEVDHPVTQQVKTEKIKSIFGELPEHFRYVPVIFGVDALGQKLLENGYNTELKTLFIVEGLLMYIPAPAVDGLLQFIATSSGSGSSVVADTFDESVIDGSSPLPEAQVLRQFVESEGAPLQFGINPDGVKAFFNQRGFSEVIQETALDCKRKFFPEASQNRSVSSMFNFVIATLT
jgi:methyltransferase (TIGR00027 family)